MKTLEQILQKEKERRHEDGMFGIAECKKSIREEIDRNKFFNREHGYNWNTSLYVLLEQYVERANTDCFFNDAMVLACWELINETDMLIKNL